MSARAFSKRITASPGARESIKLTVIQISRPTIKHRVLEPAEHRQRLQDGKAHMVSAALEHDILRISEEGPGVVISQIGRAVCRDGKHCAIQELQHEVVLGKEVREGQPWGLDEAKIRVYLIQEQRLQTLFAALRETPGDI